jgi:hypothetical protein
VRYSRTARHRTAMQFAFLRVFFPGMLLVAALFVASIVIFMAGEDYLGMMLFRILLFVFPVILLLVATAYALARKRPRLARKEIEQFIETQQAVFPIYEKSLARSLDKLANLEVKYNDMIRERWYSIMSESRENALARMDKLKAEIMETEQGMSRETKLRNQSTLAQVYAWLREGEKNRQELEAAPIPDMPEEFSNAMKLAMAPALKKVRESLESHVAMLRENLNETQEVLAEAQQLL